MRRILVGAALCAVSSVWAVPAQFVFDLKGSGFETFEPSDPVHCPNGVCTSPGQDLSWTGTLTVVTNSDADGTYGFGDLVSFTLNSSLGSFVTDGAIDAFLQIGQEVTLKDGKVVAIEGGFSPDHFQQFFFDDLDVSYTVEGCGACNLKSANAVLSPVPEPETYALMLAGLGGVGFMARRRKS